MGVTFGRSGGGEWGYQLYASHGKKVRGESSAIIGNIKPPELNDGDTDMLALWQFTELHYTPNTCMFLYMFYFHFLLQFSCSLCGQGLLIVYFAK